MVSRNVNIFILYLCDLFYLCFSFYLCFFILFVDFLLVVFIIQRLGTKLLLSIVSFIFINMKIPTGMLQPPDIFHRADGLSNSLYR